jgi:hypothetical protein
MCTGRTPFDSHCMNDYILLKNVMTSQASNGTVCTNISDSILYRAFNQGGNRAGSVEPEQHFSRIATVTADSRMSH